MTLQNCKVTPEDSGNVYSNAKVNTSNLRTGEFTVNGLETSRSNSDITLQNGSAQKSDQSGSVVPASSSGDKPSRMSAGLRNLLTLCIYSLFFSVGMSADVVGTTLLHTGLLLGTDIQGMSLSLLSLSIGTFLGSLACGWSYDRFHPDLQMALGVLGMAGFIAGSGWADSLLVYLALIFCMSLARGFSASFSQAYVLELWAASKWKNIHFYIGNGLYAAGAFACPLIAQNFLVELSYDEIANSTTTDQDLSTKSLDWDTKDNLNSPSNSTAGGIPGLRKVRYFYLTSGAMMAFFTILAFTGYMLNSPCQILKKHRKPIDATQDSSSSPQKIRSRAYTAIICCFVFIFYLIDNVAENSLPAYILAFTIGELDFTVQEATAVKSVYWVTFTLSNFVMLALNRWVNITLLVSLDLGVGLTAFIAMLFADYWNPTLMYLTCAVAGISVGSYYAVAFLWVAEYIDIGGKVSAVVVMGLAAGGSVTGPLLGYLYENISPYWMIYMTILAISIQIISFFGINVYVRCHSRHHPNNDKENVMTIERQISRGNYTTKL